MKINIEHTYFPTKICHIKAGEVIMLPGLGPTLFMLCRHNIGKNKAHNMAGNGLYSEENPVFLIDLATGEASAVPHLSSRCARVSDLEINRILPE